MYSKIISLFALAAASIALTGCGGSSASKASENNTNILGIVKIERDNYTHVGPNTFPIETDEVISRQDFSGNKYTFLWGLITIKDY